MELEEATMTAPEADRGESADASEPDDFLVYDGECPFCRFYAHKSEFKTPAGRPLKLIDANQAPEILAQMREGGCEVEEGMVLVSGGRRYQGAEAMTALGAMTSGGGWFGRLSRWFATNPGRVRAFYPWFLRLRGAALWMKGRGNPD